MRALTTTGDDDLLRLTDVPDPEPAAAEALVRVQATSLNRGEVLRARNAPAGDQVGWDVVGGIEQPAQNGSGPPAGPAVGGDVVSRCVDVVAPHGIVVSYASTLMDPAALGPRWFGAHVGATLRAMLLFDELRFTQSAASDLATLCSLIAAGLLVPHIDVEADWTRGGELARDLMARNVTGKVVLTIGSH